MQGTAGLRLRAGAGLSLVFLLVLAFLVDRGTAELEPSPLEGDGVVESGKEDAVFRQLLLEAAGDGALEPARRHLQEGLAHRRAGRLPEAARSFEKAAREKGLGDWSGVLLADLAARQGDTATVIAIMATLPKELEAIRGWGLLSAARLAAGDPWGSEIDARRALTTAPAARDSAEAFKALATAGLARGDTAAAREHVLSLLALGRPSATSHWASIVLPGLAPMESRGHLALVRHTLAAGDPASAASGIERLTRGGGADPAALDSARLLLAGALHARGRHDEALASYMALVEGDGRSPLMAAALLGAGRTHLRQGRIDEARHFLEGAERRADQDPASAQEALYILADLDQDTGALDRARARFRRAVDLDPGSGWGGESAARLGLLAYQSGDFLGSASVFEAFLAAHPGGWRFQQASYWAGMSYRRLGEKTLASDHLQAARREDPTGYYAHRAAEVTGGSIVLEPLGQDPAPDPEARAMIAGAMARVETLRSLGLADAADTEDARMRRQLSRRPGGLLHLGEHLMELGRTVEAVRTGREARRAAGFWTPGTLALVYPFPFRTEIEAAALRWAVDPYLLAGLIRQESLFQPHATSPAGAVGLAQVLPRTARAIPGLGGGREGPDLRDPAANVEAGAAYLAQLLGIAQGRLDDALVAYNAGSGRLDRWRAHPEYGDPDVFLERIPYRETREYVRTVRENAAIYAALYGSGLPAGPALAANQELLALPSTRPTDPERPSALNGATARESRRGGSGRETVSRAAARADAATGRRPEGGG